MVALGETEHTRNNKYTFRQYLGEGTFAQVWRAQDKDGRNVAIKAYKHNVSERYIMDEIQALRAISDAGLCQQYAVCYLDYYQNAQQQPRIVMEFITGESVNAHRQSIDPVTRNASTEIIEQLVNGLNELHKHGIAHQDIKGANIMWDRNAQRYRYVDWGLGCLERYCQHQPYCPPPCGSAGTAYTAAPEANLGRNRRGEWVYPFIKMSFGEEIGYDIWSLGVVLYNWYVFARGETIKEFLSKSPVLFEIDQSRLNGLVQQIPNATARQVIGLMLERDPKQRRHNWEQVLVLVRQSISPKGYRTPRPSELLLPQEHREQRITELERHKLRERTRRLKYLDPKSIGIKPVIPEEEPVNPPLLQVEPQEQGWGDWLKGWFVDDPETAARKRDEQEWQKIVDMYQQQIKELKDEARERVRKYPILHKDKSEEQVVQDLVQRWQSMYDIRPPDKKEWKKSRGSGDLSPDE